jgi:prephenate dehydrogenase
MIDRDTDFTKAVKAELKEMNNIDFMQVFFRDVQPQLRRIISERPQLVNRIAQESPDGIIKSIEKVKNRRPLNVGDIKQ